MNEKRTTVERHFGKLWSCTVQQYGETHVKALVKPYTKKFATDGSQPVKQKGPVYEGIGGFIHRRDFDFNVAASAAISSALNKAGYYTLVF
jgi:hypothetical protein